MPVQGPTRQDTFRVSLRVDGIDWGVWDALSGGKTSSAQLTTQTGGMGQVSLGGTPSTDVLTLSRLYRIERDHDNLMKLMSRVGKGRCVATQDPKDIDGNAHGKPLTWTGILTGCDPPDYDANSNSRADVTLEITPDGGPTI